jgi:hypothetical protein
LAVPFCVTTAGDQNAVSAKVGAHFGRRDVWILFLGPSALPALRAAAISAANCPLQQRILWINCVRLSTPRQVRNAALCIRVFAATSITIKAHGADSSI